MSQPCECVVCCNGEHPGSCKECAGWAEVDGKPCEPCLEDPGICPKCDGDSFSVCWYDRDRVCIGFIADREGSVFAYRTPEQAKELALAILKLVAERSS